MIDLIPSPVLLAILKNNGVDELKSDLGELRNTTDCPVSGHEKIGKRLSKFILN